MSIWLVKMENVVQKRDIAYSKSEYLDFSQFFVWGQGWQQGTKSCKCAVEYFNPNSFSCCMHSSVLVTGSSLAFLASTRTTDASLRPRFELEILLRCWHLRGLRRFELVAESLEVTWIGSSEISASERLQLDAMLFQEMHLKRLEKLQFGDGLPLIHQRLVVASFFLRKIQITSSERSGN